MCVCVCVCITESLLCTAEMKHNLVGQLCFNKIKKKKETVFSGQYKKHSNVYSTVVVRWREAVRSSD